MGGNASHPVKPKNISEGFYRLRDKPTKEFSRGDFEVDVNPAAFGTVVHYLAKDSTQQSYSIKQYRPDLENEYRAEMNALELIGKHPSIQEFKFTYKTKDGHFAIAFEYIDEETSTLESMIEKFPTYSEIHVHKVISQVADALSAAKRVFIAHRNIHPRNILVRNWDSKDFKVVISSFNFSKQWHPNHESIFQSEIGKNVFKAPEVHLESGHHLRSDDNRSDLGYSYKCDIWSLGMILYFLLSGGNLPFINEINYEKNVGEDENVDREFSFTKFALDYPGASKEGQDLMKKMLRKKPEDRLDYDQIFKHPWMEMKREDRNKRPLIPKKAKSNPARSFDDREEEDHSALWRGMAQDHKKKVAENAISYRKSMSDGDIEI